MRRFRIGLCLLGAALVCGFAPYANLPDAEVVTQLRERLVQDATLSDLGKRIHIELNGGNLVLRGPVLNGIEMTRVLRIAKEVAGTRGVTDDLTMVAE